MPVVQPAAPRSQIQDAGTSVQVVIPSPKYRFQTVFLTIWLVFWALGEITIGSIVVGAAFALLTSDDPNVPRAAVALTGGGLFLLVWLSLWTLGGVWAAYVWLWQIAGREILALDGRALTITQRVPGLSRSKTYLAEHVRALRVVPALSPYWGWPRGMEMWGMTGGPLAFDYGARTYRFGAGLDDAEAKQILATLVRRFPQVARDA